MDAAVIDDLKQFISATVVQHTSHLASKIDRVEVRITGVENRLTGIEDRLNEVEEQVHEMRVTIEDHVFTYISTVDEQVQNHEQRLVTLKK